MAIKGPAKQARREGGRVAAAVLKRPGKTPGLPVSQINQAITELTRWDKAGEERVDKKESEEPYRHPTQIKRAVGLVRQRGHVALWRRLSAPVLICSARGAKGQVRNKKGEALQPKSSTTSDSTAIARVVCKHCGYRGRPPL